MKLAVLTPTGDRPEAFALCKRYMQRQTLQPDVWFVTDDGVDPSSHWALRLPPWDKPGTSQHRNMLALLDLAEQSNCDAFVIMEDDDWYGPRYLNRCAALLESHELIGEIPARYYNVKTRHWRIFPNNHHASLCQTAFRRSMIQPMREVVASGQWIDMTFWPRYLSRGFLWEGKNVVGIKSMPGRGGVSNAHRETASWGHEDPRLEKLREWIGADADLYAEFIDGNVAPVGAQPAAWCASCGFATVAAEGDICTRCSAAGADNLRCETFQWRGVLQYRCPAGCGFNTSVLDTMRKHLSGCPVREDQRTAAKMPGIPGGLFDE